MKPVIKNTILFICLSVIGWCACAYMLLAYPKGHFELLLNHHATATLDFIFSYVTYMGDGAFQVALLLLILANKKYRQYFWPGLISFLFTVIVSYTYKYVIYVSEPRPVVFFSTQTLHLAKDVAIYHLHSFPSGHTLTAFSWALWLCVICESIYAQVLLFIVATAVAFSRVYLMQHFVEDIFAGSLMGVTCTYAAFACYQFITTYRTSLRGNSKNI